jgi:head-tail adaptor
LDRGARRDERPAEIIGLSGDESLRLGVERSVTQFRVRIRKRPSLTVTPKNRLKWNGDVMAVRSVMPDPREPRAYLILIAEIGNGS